MEEEKLFIHPWHNIKTGNGPKTVIFSENMNNSGNFHVQCFETITRRKLSGLPEETGKIHKPS